MKIIKNINVKLDIKITCRRCEVLMNNTASLGFETHLYFACQKCKSVIVLDIAIEGDIKNEDNKNDKNIQ